MIRMVSRKMSLAMSIIGIVLVVVVVGSVYETSVKDTGNSIGPDNIVITPISEYEDPYVGSAKVVVYNSVNDRGSVRYGISSDARLSGLDAVSFACNCPDGVKALSSITMTISTDMFSLNGYDSNAIKVSLDKDSRVWTGIGPYVDQYNHTMKWVFGALADDGKASLTASGPGEVYNLTFQITADAPGSHPHGCKLEDGGSGTFKISFKPSVQEESVYYLYMMNNGHGPAVGATPDFVVDSVHRFSRPADPVAPGFVFEGWYRDSECTSSFDFDSAVSGDTIVYAKWTPE